jgi:hypothetical protein
METKVKKDKDQKGIDNHKKAASHFEAASKSHMDADSHHESGNHEKAAKSTIEANGHASLAMKAQKKDTQKHISKE